RQPLWDGRDLAGKRLFVWKEQGIGDEIMFASCVPDLTASNARVTLECSPKLQPLFQRSFPFATVVTPGTVPDEERDDFDVHLPIGSLPRYYRRSLADFPDHSFLVPDPERVATWRRRLEELGPGPYVGISWRGRIQTVSRSHHYTRIEEWEPILRTPGVVFVNMQYDDAAEETARIREAFGVTLHTLPGIDMWNDLDNVAALLKALDLLISAGTAVMSIAGGVGLPTWLLWVDNVENWPCLGTDRLPWYPTMRLFSRTLKQPWTQVTQRIAGEFQAALPTLGREPSV
ncbi:MAG TPA: tetratricopeptide repeat protein, partial [Azospirillum sp.]|nr:tetratricopeptide repeat protein [Azospirillum sp.]